MKIDGEDEDVVINVTGRVTAAELREAFEKNRPAQSVSAMSVKRAAEALLWAIDARIDAHCHLGATDKHHQDVAAAQTQLRLALMDHPGTDLTFDHFAEANRARCEAEDGFRHPINSWSLADWIVATTGELGEAANVAKKIKRARGID